MTLSPKDLQEDEIVQLMADAIMAYEQESYPMPVYGQHPCEKPGDTGFMAEARAAYRALLDANVIKGETKPKKPKYKCTHCHDTGVIRWTDYSNGQGLDIDVREDCEHCKGETNEPE